MITEKIKNIFQLINFLHSNIENFKKYDSVISEIEVLLNQRSKLSPNDWYKDKIKSDEIKVILKQKFNIIESEVVNKIKAKNKELNISDWDNSSTLWNWNKSEFSNLKDDYTNEDLLIILLHRDKYIEYRDKTANDYFQTFFMDLDSILLKNLFLFFSKEKPILLSEIEKTNIINKNLKILKEFDKTDFNYNIQSSVVVEKKSKNTKEFNETQSFEVAIVCVKNDLWTKKGSTTYAEIMKEYFSDKEIDGSYCTVLKQIVSNQAHSNNFLNDNSKIDFIIKHCHKKSIILIDKVKDVFNKKIEENNQFNPKIVLELI